MPVSWSRLLVVLYVSTISLASPRRQSATSRLVLRMLFFDNCDGPSMPVRLLDKKFKWTRDLGHVVDATLSISRPVKWIRMGAVELHRCRDSQRLDICEYYATWSWKTGLCSLLVMQGMMWTPIMQSVSPPIACPVKPGTYHASNATYDLNTSVAKQLMGDKMVWKGNMIMTDQNNVTVMCLRGAIQGVKQTGP